MKITFGMNIENALRAVCYGCAIFTLIVLQLACIDRLDRAQRSVFMLKMPNVTSVAANLYCNIPHDTCRCSVIPTEHCLTDVLLKHVRIIPLLLFVLEVYLIRELVSLSGNYIYPFIYASWMTTLGIFIGILFVIYWNICYYDAVAEILCFIGYLLFGCVGFEMARKKDCNPSLSNNNTLVNVQRSERTNSLA